MKGMFYRKCKRPAAAILAAAMVLTAVNLPETSLVANAATGWEWNADYSASRYPKIKRLSAVADSWQDGGETSEPTSQNNGTPVGTHAGVAVDGCMTSFWHSNYGDTSIVGHNTITVTLTEGAQKIAGVTYLPRQDVMGNGPWTDFKIEVLVSGEWTQVSEMSSTCEDVTVLDGGVFHIDYGTRQNNWGGNNNHKFEREILFAEPIENVEQVRFTIEHSTAWSSGPLDRYLTAAEIGVLAADKKMTAERMLAEMEAKPVDIYNGLSAFIARMKTVVSEASTPEAVDAAIAELEAFEYKFADDKGEGKYLSDLRELSCDPGWGSYRKDTNIDGNGKIRLYTEDGVETYEKGIGLHSRNNNGDNGANPADAVYNVFGYKVFSADIGIDAAQSSGSPSKVIFKVLLSKEATGNNYIEVYSSEEMTAGKAAKHIEIDLLQAQRMQIVVDSCGADSSDHAVWADAKVYNNYPSKTTEEKELEIVEANAPSVQVDQEAEKAFDKNMNTQWHTKWFTDCPDGKRWIDFKLKDKSYVDAVSMLMRLDGDNGTIDESEIWVSESGHEAIEDEADDAWKADYTKVASGVWNNTTKKNLKTIHFDPVKAQYIRVVATRTRSNNANHFAAMPEFKAYGTPVTEVKTAPAPKFIDFLGGSLRRRTDEGFAKADMRFGYEIAKKNDAVGYKTAFEEWGFEYNIVDENGNGNVVTKVGENKIPSDNERNEISNLVVTNIPSKNYKTGIQCRCYVKYGLDNGEKVTLYCSEENQIRDVAFIAGKVANNSSETEENKAYANGLLTAMNQQAQ